MARWRWPEGVTRVTIFADAGNAGRQAAATLSDRLNVADIPNKIAWPIHGDDFIDDLQRVATAADYERAASADAEAPPASPI
jgi:putative DNA primase/helicase